MNNYYNTYKFNTKSYRNNLILLSFLFLIASYFSIYYLFTFTVVGFLFIVLSFIVLLFVISNILSLISNNIYISLYDDYLEIKEPYSLTKMIVFSDILSLDKTVNKITLTTQTETYFIYEKYFIPSEEEDVLEILYEYLNTKLSFNLN